MIDILVQVYIALLGAAAIFLVNSKPSKWRFWGSVIGLITQPAWFYTTAANDQWGMFVLSIWYTLAWIMGIKNNKEAIHA